MSDQNDDQKPRIIHPPSATSPSASPSAAASTRPTLLTETFEVPSSPAPDELIRLAARLANFMNLLVAEALRSRVITAGQPIGMAFLNASAAMEGGALQQRQYLAQVAMAQGGGFQGGPGGGMPPGMPPFRMPN